MIEPDDGVGKQSVVPARTSSPNGAHAAGRPRRIAVLRVDAASGGGSPIAYDRDAANLAWNPAGGSVGHDWSAERRVLTTVGGAEGVVLDGFSLDAIDTVFRLRALQILAGEGHLQIPSIVIIAESESPARSAPGLRRRIAASWPFATVVFVADGEAAELLAADDLAVVPRRLAAELGREALFAHSTAISSTAPAGQPVAMQIQPLWGRCGSSTAFANEIDCLNEGGAFTARIFIDHERRLGGTLSRDLGQIIRENVIDAGPCLEAVACPRIHLPIAPDESQADAFERALRLRTQAFVHDEVVAALAERAEWAIVNHAINVGFAARVCPNAKLVLDTHDDLTRGALQRARLTEDRRAFPDFTSLRRHAALEGRLWRAANVCVSVSLSEEARIRRHATHTLVVYPRPYVKAWRDPGPDAAFDLLIVADEHLFNVQSVEWFLQDVVSPSEMLRGLRIGIVGQVHRRLEAPWTPRLQNVAWLGFVRDLDEVRNRSRIAVCPDRGGTGVSVKALCAIAAGQPLVSTTVGLRGMSPAVLEAIPPADSAAAMARDIERLISNPESLARRVAGSHRAREALLVTGSYRSAIETAQAPMMAVEETRRSLVSEFAASANPLPDAPLPACLSLAVGGGGAPYLGDGWHEAEAWGRWMDGARATLRLPSAWFDRPRTVQFDFLGCDHPVGLDILCNGQKLSGPRLSTRRTSTRVRIEPSMRDPGAHGITIQLETDATFCPHEHDGGSDTRVLGAGLMGLRVRNGQSLLRRLMSPVAAKA